MFINIVFLLRSGRPSTLLSFVPALLLSILTPLFLPSLSHFILAAFIRECLEKYSCISSPFPVAIPNGTLSLLVH